MSYRKMKESDDINVMWMSIFSPLNFFKETPIDPLESTYNAGAS